MTTHKREEQEGRCESGASQGRHGHQKTKTAGEMALTVKAK